MYVALVLLILLEAEHVVLDQAGHVAKRLHFLCSELQMLSKVHRAGLDLSR